MVVRPNPSEIRASFSHQLTFLRERLAQPVDAASLATFRFLFGLVMVWEVIRYFSHGFISYYYLEPRFFFTYEFFPFISPLPGQGMYWLFAAMGLFALGIALGFYYRIASFLFFLSYSYVFLLDKSPYNNHYYLIILLSFLLIFVEANRWAALDRWRTSQSGPATIPFWHLFILRAQIFIVYVYGGIAKLNADWLSGEPMRTWLAERAGYPFLGPFFTTEWAVYFFSYGGLFFDLSIGFLLLWKPARFLAFLGLLFFHLMNNWLFSIGVFPFLALATTILFVEADWPRRMVGYFKNQAQPQATLAPVHPARLGPWTFGFIGVYLALQLLIPLRHWLYPGPVSWTEEGHRFAWHMKLRNKESRIEMKVIDPNTGETWRVDLLAYLTPGQIEKMAGRPDMIWQFAHYLGDKLRQAGLKPIVKANVWSALNGRSYQQLIDPEVNLAEVHPGPLAAAGWILPLQAEPSAETPPVLRWLTMVAVVLTDIGLVLTIYLALGYYRAAAVDLLSHPGGRVGQGPLASPMVRPSIPGFHKVIFTMMLPYMAVLISLAAWVLNGHLIYLGTALSMALLAAAGGFYVAPRLASSFARPSPLFWLPPLVSLVASLFFLMLIILA